MNFTFKNVYKHRKEFELACKKQGACEKEYKKLISSKTKDDFMQVIFYNFYWINKNIKTFEPKFDIAYDFVEGCARVCLNRKYGFIKTDGSYLIEPKFDYAYDFFEGLAIVKLNDKWGFIKTDGSYLIEPKFDFACDFNEGFASVKLDNKWFIINRKGNIIKGLE